MIKTLSIGGDNAAGVSEVMLYPFPMHLSLGLTYHLSILQFVQALSERIPVYLVTLDETDRLRLCFLKEFGQPMSAGIHHIQGRQRRLGFRSNRIWFAKDVFHVQKLLRSRFSKIIIYTRNIKQMSQMVSRKCRTGGNQIRYVFESHQLYSQNLAMEGRFREARSESLLEDRVYSSVDLVFANTPTLARQVSKRFNVPAVVLPVAAVSSEILDELPNPREYKSRKFDFIYAGTFSRWKGVTTFLDALALLRDSRGWDGSAALLGVREGEHKELSAQLEKLDLLGQVSLIPRVPRCEVLTFLDQARVGVLPNSLLGDSLYNTSPLKLFDYAARGLHIVASRLPALDCSIDSSVALWALPDDPEDWARVLQSSLAQDSPNSYALIWVKEKTWILRAAKALQAIQKIAVIA